MSKNKENLTIKDGVVAIPMPKQSDLARVLKRAAQPRSVGARHAKKKRPK